MRASVSVLLTAATFLCWAPMVRAATGTLARYRLGEDDPGAGASTLGQDPTRDHGAGGLDLSRSGSPHYSNDVAPGAAAATGTTLSMQFSPRTLDGYYRVDPVTKLTDNLGIEAWVKTSSDPAGEGQGVIAYDGTPGRDGFGLLRVADATPFGGLAAAYVGRMGNTTVGFIAAPTDKWTHLALVRDAGVTTFYVNGQPAGTSSAGLSAATQTFTIGSSYCPVCDRVVPTADYLDGLVDEVRVFSFSAGQFSVAGDLSYQPVPEPGAAILFTVVIPLLARRRQ